MPPIITITINPCIDISARIPQLVPDKKLHCHSLRKEPGGGGINVSRVIHRLGGDVQALYLAGGYTGAYFTQLLQAEQVPTLVIPIQEDTRENFVMLEESSGLQYKFGMPGPVVTASEWMQCLDVLSGINGVEYFVASGSLPEGVPTDIFARIAKIAQQKNARLVLDTSGPALQEALNEGVYLVKPNLGELGFLSGVPEPNPDTALAAARELIAQKRCEVIVVSMGADGALMVTASTAARVQAPVVPVRSTVGAGDSMVAGIVLSLSRGSNINTALQWGIACGSATTLNEGTALCKAEDVERLLAMS